MKRILALAFIPFLSLDAERTPRPILEPPNGGAVAASRKPIPFNRIAELDAYWAEVSRAVNQGDFDAYQATCHPEGILVSGNKKTSQPLAEALARWKQDFVNTKAGKVKARVEFRFSQRLGDDSTAHETGIFLYTSQAPGEEPKREYVHLEALLTKKPDGWKILMEYQKSPATEAEWDQLK